MEDGPDSAGWADAFLVEVRLHRTYWVVRDICVCSQTFAAWYGERGGVPDSGSKAGSGASGEWVYMNCLTDLCVLGEQKAQTEEQGRRGLTWGRGVLPFLNTRQLRCVTEEMVFHLTLAVFVVVGQQRGVLQ